MPKKNAKTRKPDELDGVELFAAINLIEEEKSIPKAHMLEKITQALVSTYKRDHEGAEDNMTVKTDEEAGTVHMFAKKDMAEEVGSPHTEMSLQMTREKLSHARFGDVIRIEVRIHDLGRIAAQTARQVIIQGMWKAERRMIYDEFSSKEHKILVGMVTCVDPRSGAVSLRIDSGSEATGAFLALGEQVKGETYLEGMHLHIYIVKVRRSTKGSQVLISRTHPGLVKHPSELKMPEIYDGVVEIKSTAHKVSSCTKLTVWSADPNASPIGACVGPRSQRVNNIVKGLKGEEVDIIKRSEGPAEYIAAALFPANIASVAIRKEGKACHVVMSDDQLSLTISKKGQNARLVAKSTGRKIGIKPVSTLADGEPEDEEDALLDDEAETKKQALRGRPSEWDWPSLEPVAGETAPVLYKGFVEGKALVWGNSVTPNGMKTGPPQKGSAFCGVGQNARLATKLTGWKIDIKPVSTPSGEEPGDEEDILLNDGAGTEE